MLKRSLVHAVAMAAGLWGCDDASRSLVSENASLRKEVGTLRQQAQDNEATLQMARRLFEKLTINESGDIVISGANLFIQNGLGPSGVSYAGKNTGNLILGYDEQPSPESNCAKTSQHSLIIGPGHCRDQVSGGFAHGAGHTLVGEFPGAYGGAANRVATESVVVGGYGNKIDISGSLISGGVRNHIPRGAYGVVTITASSSKTVTAGHLVGESRANIVSEAESSPTGGP